MSGSDEVDPQKGEPSAAPAPPDTKPGQRDPQKGKKVPDKRKPPSRPADVGRALRSVYDDTLREDIPSDLRELLGRLG